MSGAQSTTQAPTGTLPHEHPPVDAGKVGVLLINLGTPDGTDYWSMRRYLKEFLSDRRVIEWPRLLWYPILHGIVLSKRPQKSGEAYKEIWNNELDESPLRTITRSQSEQLKQAFKFEETDVKVDWAMRYGNPSIRSRLQAMKDEGCERILVFPLYPQYSASTTATVNDEVFRVLMDMRWQPALRTVPPYHDHPVYVNALAASVEATLEQLPEKPEVILTSYHGIPQSYFKKGDPYHCHCMKTTRLLREKLGMDEKQLQVTFQSRFGPEEWLQPYTDKTIEKLAKEGVKRIAVMNPGFVADCLETLEEIAGEGAEIFEENGGKQFTHIPCLNDSEPGMKTIHAIVKNELAGWI
ncbi:ferrochelatase [Flexibacterium corallicola]|uniref:ferrochelatase n=1 Tax=Flexibacterium corallicola TaxID=3037259 RepID=UPI00286F0BA8|nr:ferrochelatase [Pseudovibrio sp. M1P-2-3]